jgi:hypothetical protein
MQNIKIVIIIIIMIISSSNDENAACKSAYIFIYLCKQYGMCLQPLLWQRINTQLWANATVAGKRMRAQQRHGKHHVTQQ